ncbi:hypothetical protein WDJ51_14545 [Rathayibacter sp. YIM 133350]|uniref:hypothetical protein n=1 Tax=Rathayibacter sp. YIM 133350 TaxID=3131992 RepID=UPI00307D3C94
MSDFIDPRMEPLDADRSGGRPLYDVDDEYRTEPVDDDEQLAEDGVTQEGDQEDDTV